MAEYTYRALKVEQRHGAEPFYLTKVSAEELLYWAEPPQKKAGLRAGYQRSADDQRLKRITEFLSLDPKNIMPGSVLVALRSGTFTISEEEDGLVEITVTVSDEDLSTQRMKLTEELRDRLALAAVAVAHEDDDAFDNEDVTSLGEGEDLPLEEDEDEDPFDEDDNLDEPPGSYLEAILNDFENYEGLDDARKDEVDKFTLTFWKPGKVLDGQHRVYGARNFAAADATPVFLPAVLLPGMGLAEQAFHFYVINQTAKSLTATELRSIVSTSLTPPEIKDLWDRFKQARVDPEEAQYTYRVDTDVDSPFQGLIDFGLQGKDAPISDNVMDAVVKKFVKMPRARRNLYKDESKWAASLDYRLSLFYALWSGVKESYPNAWANAEAAGGAKLGPSHQIFYKVSLLQVQEYLLQKLEESLLWGKAPFSSPEALKDGVDIILGKVDESFFLDEWKKKGLDTHRGKKIFLDSLTTAAESSSKKYGNVSLFKE